MTEPNTILIDFTAGGPNVFPWKLEVEEGGSFVFVVKLTDDIKRAGIFFKDPSHRFFAGESRRDLLPALGWKYPKEIPVEATAPNFNLEVVNEAVECAYGVYGIRADGKRVEIDPEIVVRKI